MHEAKRTIYSPYLFGLIQAFPSVLLTVLLISQQGPSLLNVCIAFLMIVFSVLSGRFLSVWYSNQQSRRNDQLHPIGKSELKNLMAYTTELESLLQRVIPKIGEQTLAARELTEKEISLLIGRFSAILDGVRQIIDLASQDSKKPLPDSKVSLKTSAEKIRAEVDVVLESLQFQDRVSQILTQVGENLSNLRTMVDQIQLQGNKRNQDMIRVEEMLARIQSKYESVNQLPQRLMKDEDAFDELTFF